MREAAVWAFTFVSKAGTVCVSSASTGLCGGQRVTAVPTATRRPPGRHAQWVLGVQVRSKEPTGRSAADGCVTVLGNLHYLVAKSAPFGRGSVTRTLIQQGLLSRDQRERLPKLTLPQNR